MAREIYYSMDETKFIVKKVKDWTDTITYIWESKYCRVETSRDSGYCWPDDIKKPIWRIKKLVEDEDWNMEVFYPEGDTTYRFVRDDRENLTYL